MSYNYDELLEMDEHYVEKGPRRRRKKRRETRYDEWGFPAEDYYGGDTRKRRKEDDRDFRDLKRQKRKPYRRRESDDYE